MAARLKRKTSSTPEEDEASAKRRFIESEPASLQHTTWQDEATQHVTSVSAKGPAPENGMEEEEAPQENAQAARLARFKALRARQTAGAKQNAKEVQRENDRGKINPELLKKLDRKNAIASHKLLKEDTEAAGGDFERKRAWDWTVEESERWDERMTEKARKRDDVSFSNYQDEARKVYERQMRDFKPDLEAYERGKLEAIQQAAVNGGLEIVETETGELIAVDRDGKYLSTSGTQDFHAKPSKEALDRLVGDIRKAEEVRLVKRKARMKSQQGDDGDVTYINEKNKQFNEKLNRFYDKYTADLRENMERGTAL